MTDQDDSRGRRRHDAPTSRCTLVTSGQVASNTLSPRASASCLTARDTPWALKITVRSVRHFVEFLDEHRARVRKPSTTNGCAPPRGARRSAHRMFQRALDDFDGTVDAGAEATRIGEQDFHGRQFTIVDTENETNPGVCNFPMLIQDLA